MVENLLKFFGRELKSVPQAAFLLAVSGILADILALLRDRLLASEFGASRALDLYYVSFRIPDFIYTLSLFFAASTALIPIVLEKFSESDAKGREFIGSVFSLFLLVIIVLVAAAYLLMPYLIPYAAPGFSAEEQSQVILLSRILLLSPFLLGLSNLVSSVIQSFRRFYIYALSPLFYNLGIILGIIVFYPLWGLPGIVWGVVLGAGLHLLIQLPTVSGLGFPLRPRFPKISPDIVASLKLSVPRTLGLSLNQLVSIAITAIGSTLGAGAVAVFNLATNLQSVPLSVIGLSYSIGAFPTLAASYVENKKEEFLKYFSLAFRHIVFWSLPATVLFIVLRAQIVRVVLGAGAFSWVDTRLTAASLFLLALSILAQGLIMLLVRAFYAAGHTFLPVGINLVSSIATVGGALWALGIFRASAAFREWLLEFLKVGDVPGGEILLLPLAISLGSFINIVFLLIYFKKIFGSFGGGPPVFDPEGLRPERAGGLNRSFRDAAISSVVLGAVSYYALKPLALVFTLDTFAGVFFQGFLAGVLGLSAGAGVLYSLKNREFKEFSMAFREKFWKKIFVIASEPEKLP